MKAHSGNPLHNVQHFDNVQHVGHGTQVDNVPGVGSRRMTTKSPAPPRSGLRKTLGKFSTAVSTAASHFFNAVTPQGVRVAQKQRAAYIDSGKETRRLLKDLVHPQAALTPKAVERAFDRIESAAQPLITYSTFEDVLSKRLAVHLKGLDAKEIKTLTTQLKVLRSQSADTAVEAHLSCLAKALREEAQHRAVADCAAALLPDLKKAISQATTQPQLAVDTYDGLRATALGIMGQYRLTEGHTGKSESKMARAVIAMAIDSMLLRGAIPEEDIKQLIRILPGEEQAWLKAPPFDNLTTQKTPLLTLFATLAADEKVNKLSLEFDADVVDVLGASKIGGAASAQCLQYVINAASHWSELQKRRTALAMDDDPFIGDKLLELRDHVASLVIDPAELDKDKLSDQQLAALSKALETLDIPGRQTKISTISEAIEGRLSQGIKDCSDALLPALELLEKGDTPAALTALAALQNVVSRVNVQHDVLRALDNTGADNLRHFEYVTYDALFQSLEEKLSERCLAILGAANTRHLSDVLNDMGSDLQIATMGNASDPRHAIAVQLVGISQILSQLLDSATRVHPPSNKEEKAPAKPTPPFTSVRKTVRAVFQIPPQRASDAAQAVFQGNLLAMKEEEPLRGHIDSTGDRGIHTGVHPSTWNDIGRATHYIENPDGSLTLQMSRDKFSADPEEKLRQRQEVVQRWEELAGHDPIGLHNLSDALNQRVMAGFAYAMASPHSPIRLPDGTPGSVSSDNSGEHSRTTYMVRAGQQPGEWRIRIERELDQLNQFVDPATGTPTELDPERSYVRFTAELVVRADGRIDAPEPFSFDYHLEAKPADPL